MTKNMESHQFRCDPAMIVPVALAMASGFALLFLEGLTNKGLLLLVLLAPFFYLGAEILARKIEVDSQGITVFKLLRTVRMPWNAIQSVDAVKAGKKVFLILHNSDGRHTLITNTIGSFRDLVIRIAGALPESRVTQGARDILADPPRKSGPTVQAWLACIVLSAMAIGKLMGY